MSAFTSFSGKTRAIANHDTVRAASFSEIPIISLEAPLSDLISQLRDACTRVGFFYITDHGVPQEIIHDTFMCAENFFALDRDTKSECHYKKSKILRGYEPPDEVRTDETKKADMNEAFNWGYSPELDPLADPMKPVQSQFSNPMTGPNAWPSMENFKPTMAAYYGQVLTLARRLIRLFAQVLDLPPTHFDHMFYTPGAMCRILHYPPQPPTSPTFGIGAHTDIECFTILCQGTQPALQILSGKGEWLSAPPIPETFVVNIGDMLSYWSNDIFVSTVHRVLNITGEERYSIPFFMGPNYETLVEPLENCVKEGKKNYESVLAGDYVWRRLAKSRFSDEEYNKMFSESRSCCVIEWMDRGEHRDIPGPKGSPVNQTVGSSHPISLFHSCMSRSYPTISLATRLLPRHASLSDPLSFVPPLLSLAHAPSPTSGLRRADACSPSLAIAGFAP